jgi:branched-subunit amino acid transport protein
MISGWYLWLVIAGMALITIINRAGMILLAGKFDLPPALRSALRFAPPAALAAIAVPDLFLIAGQLSFAWNNPRLLAGVIGFALAVMTRSTMLAIIGGMIALHGLQAVLT